MAIGKKWSVRCPFKETYGLNENIVMLMYRLRSKNINKHPYGSKCQS